MRLFPVSPYSGKAWPHGQWGVFCDCLSKPRPLVWGFLHALERSE